MLHDSCTFFLFHVSICLPARSSLSLLFDQNEVHPGICLGDHSSLPIFVSVVWLAGGLCKDVVVHISGLCVGDGPPRS